MTSIVNTKHFNLPREIIQRSEGDNWKEAVQEWELEEVEMLDPGECSTCLCGHYPIRELCHIRNIKNDNKAIVGNHCIELFEKEQKEQIADTEFSVIPKIIQACRRILQDMESSANLELIDYAKRMGVFNETEAKFYRKIWRRRSLTDKEWKAKCSLNRKLLYQVILSTRGAYQRLKTNPINGTMGPKLICEAFRRVFLTHQDRDFYMSIWNRSNRSLTERQLKYKRILNNRILIHLKDVLDAPQSG